MLLRTAGRDSEGTAGASVHLERTAFIWSVRNLHAVYGFQSRLLAVAVMLAVTLIFLAMDIKEKRIKGIALFIGMMVCCVVWCFPAVFTAQRIFPTSCLAIFSDMRWRNFLTL